MNREIKFRSWNERSNIMSIVFSLEDALRHEVDFIDGSVFMEYTGLKDKNGVEIFEGDIVEYSNGMILGVEFHKGCFVCVYRCDFGDDRYKLNSFVNVIGNIYENPELLEEQNV